MTLAANFVLLPPPEIWESATLLNEQINEGTQKPEIIFNATHFPHITLVQAYIDTHDLETITEKMEKLAGESAALELTASKITKDELGFASLNIELTDPLSDLHGKVLELLQDSFRPYNNEGFFLDSGETVPKVNYEYTEKFHELETYVPHITLGKLHEKIPEWAPKKFTAATLAFCQLGNWGTCRKILKAWQLS